MNLPAAIILESLGLLLVLTFVALGVVMYYECHERSFRESGVLSKIISIMCFVAVIIGFSVGVFFTVKEYKTSYEELEYNIYSLDRGIEIEGHFTLGTGSINTNIAYYFYIETYRGFELKSIANSDTKIYLVETEERDPCIVTKKESNSFEKYKIIYVPIGTIVRAYTG